MSEALVEGTLTSYLPPHVLRRLTSAAPAPAPHAERFQAAVLLADIRGFTRMTELMASRGPDGVEMFTDAMNRYFGGMIDHVVEHGGEVVSFAGDALLAVWPVGEGTPTAALDAAAGCALVLATRDAAVAPGVDARLRVRLAVATGEVAGLEVGRPSRQIYCALMGAPIDRVSEAIDAADAGEVATDAAGWELLRDHAEGRPAKDAFVVTAVTHERRPKATAPPPEPGAAVLEPYIAPSVIANETAAHGTWIAELRRVTAIFVDLPDLVYDSDLAGVQELIVALQADFERHSTQLNQIGVDNHGTSLLAAAGLPPHAHADDPERGIRTALAIADTLRRLNWRGTVGVASGRVLCVVIGNEMRREYMVMGDSINVAARLSTSGDGSERVLVLCDATTAEATRRRIEYGPPMQLRVKGKTLPITAFRPLGRRGPTAGPGTAAFGRRREQRVLRAAIEAGVGGGSRTVAIQAEPGLGKSHLLAEAAELAAGRGMRCLFGSGDAIEQATPYHGWRHVFETLLNVDDRINSAERDVRALLAIGPRAPLLNPVLGLNLADTPETAELQNERRIQATRQFLLELLSEAASTQPLLIALDDAHWLDSASWALVREYVRRGLPGVTLLASRPTGTLAPEYAQVLDEPGAELIELSPLSEDDALDLAAERLGAAWLGAGVSELILDRAAGNPLFVEELARALADAGVIRVDASGTCMVAPGANLDDLGLPDTVEGVIANRMEGLDPPVDLTLKVSSVVGPMFAAELVHDVYPLETDAARLDTSLDALVRRDLTQLIQPPPGTSYSFRHALIRDVAYQRLLFAQRRELHRAIGEWHELHFAENLAPVYATLAHHYTRAGDVERACDYLGRASVQAINNGMGREAVDLGLAAAAMLGVELPRTLPEIGAAIGERLGMIGAQMAERSIESLAELPEATDPVRAAAIGALLQTAPAAFISQQSELFALIGLEGFRLTLETGRTPYLPGVLALYALITRNLDPDPRPAFALSSMAERLAERDSPPLLANAGFVHSWFVHHWVEPIPAILPRIPARAEAGFTHGDVMMACFNTAGYVTLLAASGAPLDEVIAAGTSAGERIAGRVAAAAFHCTHEVQFAKALAGRTTSPTSLTDAPREGKVDEERDLASIRHTDLINQQGYYLTSKLRLHFYYRDHARALAFGDQAERVRGAFRAQQQEVEFVFFHGLALLAHARETGDEAALARGVQAIDEMRGWARFAPEIFEPRVAIMEGQLAWARADRSAAVERLTAGAAGADRHHAALAHELAGRCLLEAGDALTARDQLSAAADRYAEWGATAKVQDIAAAL